MEKRHWTGEVEHDGPTSHCMRVRVNGETGATEHNLEIQGDIRLPSQVKLKHRSFFRPSRILGLALASLLVVYLFVLQSLRNAAKQPRSLAEQLPRGYKIREQSNLTRPLGVLRSRIFSSNGSFEVGPTRQTKADEGRVSNDAPLPARPHGHAQANAADEEADQMERDASHTTSHRTAHGGDASSHGQQASSSQHSAQGKHSGQGKRSGSSSSHPKTLDDWKEAKRLGITIAQLHAARAHHMA